MKKLYEGYLTEEKLGKALETMFEATFTHNRAFPGYRFRPDYVNHDLKLVVEYNGHLHYTQAKSVLIDEWKKSEIIKIGYRHVEIPYFIQIDKAVMNNIFCVHNDNIEFTDFPHGFITDSCVLPADFCVLGLLRMHKEMDEFEFTKADVRKSLQDKIRSIGHLLVVPEIHLSCGCSLV